MYNTYKSIKLLVAISASVMSLAPSVLFRNDYRYDIQVEALDELESSRPPESCQDNL
jgi:hypothetical protein